MHTIITIAVLINAFVDIRSTMTCRRYFRGDILLLIIIRETGNTKFSR